jgi:endonuclease-3
MSASNRAALVNKTYKVLKKYFKPVKPPTDRTLLEHLLYACCLENAPFEAADEAFARLQQSFFDWNEVRVTTVAELAEHMPSVPDAKAAAAHLKRCLQSVFETHYAFDIEFLHKQNLGKSVEDLEKIKGTTPFSVAYVAQNGLGGHAIPLCAGTLGVLEVLGLVNENDAKKHRVPNLERSIPKSKGTEFGSLLHQLGAELHAAPQSHKARTVLLEIDPDAKARLVAWSERMAARAEAVRSERPPVKERKSAAPAAPPMAQGEAAPPAKPSAKPPTPSAKPPTPSAKPPTPPAKPTSARRKKTSAREAGEDVTTLKSPTKQLTRKKPR